MSCHAFILVPKMTTNAWPRIVYITRGGFILADAFLIVFSFCVPRLFRSPKRANSRQWPLCTASAMPSLAGCSCCSWASCQVPSQIHVFLPQFLPIVASTDHLSLKWVFWVKIVRIKSFFLINKGSSKLLVNLNKVKSRSRSQNVIHSSSVPTCCWALKIYIIGSAHKTSKVFFLCFYLKHIFNIFSFF